MVVDDLRAERSDKAVIRQRGRPFKEGIGRSGLTNTIHDFAAFLVFLDELIQHFDIILKVRIHRYDTVTLSERMHQAAEQRVLMAAVMRQLHTVEVFILRSVGFDQGPGLIAAAVVDKDDPALIRNRSGLDHAHQFVEDAFGSLRKHFFFVITRNHNKQDRLTHFPSSLFFLKIRSLLNR